MPTTGTVIAQCQSDIEGFNGNLYFKVVETNYYLLCVLLLHYDYIVVGDGCQISR